jgi:uncharacterized protein Yka (UPF0111/DUF47 family)
MDEFEAIARTLRRQRKDLDDQFDQTASRSNETTRLLEKIQELARRSEATNQIVIGQPTEPAKK